MGDQCGGVFYDPSGKRQPGFRIAVTAIALALFIAAAFFFVSLKNESMFPPLRLPQIDRVADFSRPSEIDPHDETNAPYPFQAPRVMPAAILPTVL